MADKETCAYKKAHVLCKVHLSNVRKHLTYFALPGIGSLQVRIALAKRPFGQSVTAEAGLALDCSLKCFNGARSLS